MAGQFGRKSRKGDIGRLLEKVTPEPNSGCWLWEGATNTHGYGQIWRDRRLQLAHRVSYELHCGPISDGKDLDHLCRIPLCVNPSHLEPVSHAENCRRGDHSKSASYQRNKVTCPGGHSYSDGNIYYRSNGHRECRACSLARSREYQRRKRAGEA